VGLSALRIVWTNRSLEEAELHSFEWRGLEPNITMSFLGLQGLHVFVTGAAGGIGCAIVDEFLGRCFGR
jgi:FlaA1/EpsC-like NDP-sugar epimerase